MRRKTSTHPAVSIGEPNGRTTVYLTGFGPFPSVPVNATMMLVPRLAAAARLLFPSVRIVTEILPTEWIAAPARVDEGLAAIKPDLVLHFGVSSRARGFEIETRGRNSCAMTRDAAGAHPGSQRVRADGQNLLPSRVPVARIVQRLRQAGLPAYQSWNAGTYLCNATLYHALASTADASLDAGFVHIPDALAPARQHYGGLRTSPGCPLTWPQALEGGLLILATCLARPHPPAALLRRAVFQFGGPHH